MTSTSRAGDAGVTLKLIFARAANGVIGRDKALPWHLPEDLAHFKRTTLGCTVIMGRKTWDSLPPKFRPLPGRRNIVVTRQNDWAADGAIAVRSFEQAVAACHAEHTAWVIGGAEIYATALSCASTVVVTDIDANFEGDAYAPELGNAWTLTTREPVTGWHLATNGLRYAFSTYKTVEKTVEKMPLPSP